jgi:hypothetical protein
MHNHSITINHSIIQCVEIIRVTKEDSEEEVMEEEDLEV